MIEKFYLDKQIVSPATLVENKILSRASGKLPKVKILGKGELKKKINIQDCLVSRSVKAAIEKAGGVIM
jgi:ribosomal protein L15